MGAFAVTFLYNVPLNESLAQVQLAASATDLDDVRRSYVEPWTRWNVVRTVASTAAFLTLCAAIFLAGRDARIRQTHDKPVKSLAPSNVSIL